MSLTRKCPIFTGSRRCGIDYLKKKGKPIIIPTEKLDSSGWITSKWWSNGGYAIGEDMKRLCLETKPYTEKSIGYNALVKKNQKMSKGLVWKDSDNQGCVMTDLVKSIQSNKVKKNV